MTKSRTFLLILAAGLAGAMLFGQSFAQSGSVSPAAATRIAVCDVVAVFNNYERAKDLTAKLNERRKSVQAENEKRRKAVEAINMELEGLKPGSAEYEKRLNELQRLSIEREAWLKFQEMLTLREHHRLTEEMYNQIIDLVGAVAKENDLQIVLYRETKSAKTRSTAELLQQIQRRKILYSDDSVDLTELVLTRLNIAYRAAGR